jgi:lia operon protein LiaG
VKEGVSLQKILIIMVVLVGAFLLLISIPSWLPFGEQTADVNNDIDIIDIDVSSISTTIVPEKRDNVEAVLDGNGTVQVRKSGNRIEIEYNRKWYQPFGFLKRPRLTIYLPEDYHRDLAIEVGSGNINSKNLQIQNLELDVNSGNINMDHITAQTGNLDVRSGNIDLQHYNGRLEADISSGNLAIQMDELTDSVKVDLSSGHVELDLPDHADFTLDGNVSSGFISSSFPLKNKEESKQELKGINGTGEHHVELSVSSGKIEVK